jgi:hypothetical protein
MKAQETDENTKGNTGVWFNKNNFRDFTLIFDPATAPPEGYVRTRPLKDAPFQKYDEDAALWIEDAEAQQRHSALAERDAIKAEIAARDYRALKAIKLSQSLDALYPGESEWYAQKLDRLHEIENMLEVPEE